MTTPILARDRVCAGYAQSTVLFDLSLEIETGECIGLLGRNGVGKTTTIRAVMGLTPAVCAENLIRVDAATKSAKLEK
jgi:branched-chain amino acid transport system ATP-binding protein